MHMIWSINVSGLEVYYLMPNALRSFTIIAHSFDDVYNMQRQKT